MAKPMLERPYRYWLIAALIAALIYYAWGEITRTRGNQKVSFRPAEQACDTSGSLRYCVYRDRRGTNGDIIYHLHGRNLDERIWNDGTYLTALIQAEWQRRLEMPPTVVTVSYGSTWLLTPKRGEARQRAAGRSDGPSAGDRGEGRTSASPAAHG